MPEKDNRGKFEHGNKFSLINIDIVEVAFGLPNMLVIISGTIEIPCDLLI